jgi:hypothetical protein
MSSVKKVLCALICQVLMVGFAWSADSLEAVQMQFKQSSNNQSQQWGLLIGDERVVTLDVNGRVMSIFDAADNRLYTLDHTAQTYRISDAQSVRQAAAKVQQGMRAIESKIAALPAAQQSEVRQQLMASFPQRQEVAADSRFEPNGRSGTFAGVDCQWYETLVDEEAVGRICATAPDQLEGGPSLYSMLESISRMYAEMEKADLGGIALPIPENPMAPVARLGLIPIKMEQYDTAVSGTADVELMSINRQRISPAALQLPPGFTRQDSGGVANH